MDNKIKNLKILAWPKIGLNPYNEILYEKLEEHGVTVISHRDARLSGITSHVDVFHFHWLNAYLSHSAVKSLFSTLAFIAYILLLKIKKTKIVWTAHNTVSFTHSKKNILLEKLLVPFLIKYVDKIIVHSKFQINHFSEQYHSKIIHIPHHNYCPTLHQKIHGKNDYYLFFGSVSPYKGLDLAIQAYNMASSSCCVRPFKIVGSVNDSAYKMEISNLIQNNKTIFLEDRFISNSELELLVKGSKAVILPFRQITNSGSLIYALSCRTPVFVRWSKLVDEVISAHNGIEKVLFTFKDEKELVSLITKDVEVDLSDFDAFIANTDISRLVRDYYDVFFAAH